MKKSLIFKILKTLCVITALLVGEFEAKDFFSLPHSLEAASPNFLSSPGTRAKDSETDRPSPKKRIDRVAMTLSQDDSANEEKVAKSDSSLSASETQKTRILPPSSDSKKTPSSHPSVFQSLVSMAIKLFFVAAAVFFIFYYFRRCPSVQKKRIPPEVIDVVGEFPLTLKNRLTLLRFSSKLLLVSISGEQVTSIAQIDDPREIERVLDLCQQENSVLNRSKNRSSRIA